MVALKTPPSNPPRTAEQIRADEELHDALIKQYRENYGVSDLEAEMAFADGRAPTPKEGSIAQQLDKRISETEKARSIPEGNKQSPGAKG